MPVQMVELEMNVENVEGMDFFVSCTDGSCQNMDCNGECKTGTLFECSGANCGGAVIDNCGVCAGGSTGKYINGDYDACDIGGGPNTDCSNGYDAQTCPNMDEYCGSCTGVADCLPKLNDIYSYQASGHNTASSGYLWGELISGSISLVDINTEKIDFYF